MSMEKLPETVEIEMFITLGIGRYNTGSITALPFNAAKGDDERILLSTQMVTFDIPQDVDIKGKAIEGLEAKKSRLQAKHHMEIKEVQDKLDQLLAIEYNPEGETNDPE